MNKMQMEDAARAMIIIAEDILSNIEDVDFAEVRELIANLSYKSDALLKEIGRGQ